MITYQQCNDLAVSARLTYNNMRVYYEKFAPDWDESKVLEQISELDNLDILKNGEIVGVMRFENDENFCYLRDIQINQDLQNNGIGVMALDHAVTYAKEKGVNALSLRVLKISPAYRLYKRNGFTNIKEDDRFYYMERKIS